MKHTEHTSAFVVIVPLPFAGKWFEPDKGFNILLESRHL